MTGLAFKNNAKTTLSSGVNDSTTTIPVTEGSVFPVIDATDPATDVFFFVTLDDDTNNEIVKVTASTGSSGNQNLTVVRAQEGTTARAFSSGDKVELRLTAGMVDTFNLSGNDITLSSNKMGFGDSTPEVSLDLGSQTDSLHVPVGTTAQRPGSPEAGYLRYNSTTGKFEGYTNAWGDLADGSDFLVTNTYTTANASTTAFTISNAVQDEKQLLVFIDGVFQAHNSYSVSGTTVTLSTAPASGREVTIYSALSNLQGANMVIATMTGDNSDTTLDLGVTPVSENNVQVYIDGTYQNKDTYSISGQILTFSTAPPTGTAVEAITHTVLDISAAASSVLIDEFTGNGSTTAFTLAAAPANENNTQVYVGGVYQEKATYSVSGTTLTLTEAPANGVSVEVMSIAVGQINSAIQLSDADGDTKIQVEESSDEDTIRMDIAGTEVLTLTNSAMTLKGTTPTITIGDGGAEDTKIIFDGNTVDYYIGLDDSQDDLVIGKGTTLGTDPAIQVNADERVGLGGAPVTQLHVMGGNGVIFDNPNNGYSGLKITDDTSSDYNINFLAGRSQGGTKFKFFRYGRDQNTTPWSDYSSPVEIAHISGNSNYFAGKVGIGTTSPGGPLHVKSSTNKTIIADSTFSTGSFTSLAFQRNGTDKYRIFQVSDDSYLGFYNDATANTQMSLHSNDNILFNRTNASFNNDGTVFGASGGSYMYIERSISGNAVIYVHRRTTDGDLIQFYQGNSFEGSISVSGANINYGGFTGTHDSSGTGISSSTQVGTVLSTIDEEHKPDHAKVKVSNTEGDTRVYGVLQEYKAEETSDTGITSPEHAVVASVGVGSVLVTGACNGGDLLESNGDGTAKVQDDDIIRSKTIGKVTMGNTETGVKLVSCVLYCG